VRCSALQYVAPWLVRVDGCVAVCCMVFQCVAVCCRVLVLDLSELIDVLQCVMVCCSVLQCVAVCCSVLQCVATWLVRVDWCVTLCYSMLHGDALCCIAFQCIATWPVQVDGCAAVCCACCRVLQCCVATRLYWSELMDVLQCVACVLCVRCSTLQYVAVHCSASQCIATGLIRGDGCVVDGALLVLLVFQNGAARLPDDISQKVSSAVINMYWADFLRNSITQENSEAQENGVARLSDDISQKVSSTVMNIYWADFLRNSTTQEDGEASLLDYISRNISSIHVFMTVKQTFEKFHSTRARTARLWRFSGRTHVFV